MTTGRVAVGHPVDVGSGVVFTVCHDFEIPGTIPLLWRRYYGSSSAVNSWHGRGWSTPWFLSLRRTAQGYELTNEEGGQVLFPSTELLPVGQTVFLAAANMELRRLDNALVVLHWHHGSDAIERYYFAVIEAGTAPLAWVENLAGHRVLVQYDELARPVRLIQELEQRTVELSYDVNNRIAGADAVADEIRRPLARYGYDTAGRLLSVTDALGGHTTYGYDAAHRLIAETNPMGSTFSFQYDERGRCIVASGDGGFMARRLQYFNAPKMTRVADSLGNTTEYFLNPNGQVLQEKSPLGAITTRAYDDVGREASVKYPDGGEDKFAYDDRGNRTVLDECGAAIKTEYNDLHLPTVITEPNGAEWKFEYDERGNLVATQNPLGNRWTYVRDPRGLVLEARTPGGLIVRHSYDGRLRWQEGRDQFGLIDRIEYDAFGNEVAFHDAQGVVRRTVYDALDRPIEVVDAGGYIVRCRWNATGEMVERIAGAQREVWEYDPFGNLIAQTNPLGGTMLLEYNSEGKLTGIVNRAGERMEFGYNQEGKLAEERQFDGRVQRMEYDLGGRAVRILRSDGRVIAQKFDKCARIVGRESSDGLLEEFAWDARGDLKLARNKQATVELERNPLGRVVAEVQNGKRIEYEYDADNNRVARRLVDIPGSALRMGYDQRGRLTSIADQAGAFQHFGWDGLDRLTERTTVGGLREVFTYDPARRLQSQTVAWSAGRPIVSRRYSYNTSDNLETADDQRRGATRYSYDALNRLTEVFRGATRTEFYRYDAIGAILESHQGVRSGAGAGRTAGDGVRQFEYDAGGCIARVRSPEGVLELKYDVDEKLVSAVLPGGIEIEYAYDPFGRRIGKRVGAEKTEFLWEGCEPAAELNGAGTEAYFFMDREPVAQWRNGERLVPVTGRSGAVQEILTEHGAVRWEGTLDSYGNLLAERGAPTCPYRFRGQYHDRETGFHYNFLRTYDPRLGDFISPDPIGVAGGANLYIYPRDPLSWDDPFGLKCNQHKGKRGESRMDGYYARQGYKRISNRDSVNGIDGVYYNPNGKPPYIIAEAKYGSSQLSRTTDGNKQMSDGWIDSPIRGTGAPRLERVVGKTQATAIRTAAANGNVGKELYHAPAGTPGSVVAVGQYTGSGSSEHDMLRL